MFLALPKDYRISRARFPQAVLQFRVSVSLYLTRNMTPAAVLGAAVHEAEARIDVQVKKSPGMDRDATHLSACLLVDTLDCTILDIGEGSAYLIDRDGIWVPRTYPSAVQVKEPGPGSPDDREENRLPDMISRTLGEPHVMRKSDFVTVNIRSIFLLISSGGLHDYVRKERIAEIVLRNEENVETSCEQLLQEALKAGSERTITVVLVHGQGSETASGE